MRGKKRKNKQTKSEGPALTPRQKRLADKAYKAKRNVVVSCGIHMDANMNVMEETRFKKKKKYLIESLVKKSHLTFNEIEALLLIYYNLCKLNGPKCPGIYINQFIDVLHNSLDLTDADLNIRIASACFVSAIPGTSNMFSMESWVMAFSLFLRGNSEERITHCYKVYDWYNYGLINRENMVSFLEPTLFGEEDPEDAARDFAEIVQKKMDIDRDGKISFLDFKSAVKEQPLLMEVFGRCLPSPYAAKAFLSSFTKLIGNEYKDEVANP